jgi:hypothetical protein
MGLQRRMVRIPSVMDVFTRECLSLEASCSLGSGRVIRVLGSCWNVARRRMYVRTMVGIASRGMIGRTEEK